MAIHAIDYVVFAITLCVSMAIGVFYAIRGAKSQTSSDYMMGERKMVLLPVAISMVATLTSGVGLLGTPAEIYTHGSQFSMYVFSIIIGLGASLFTFVPLLHPLKMTSVFEYLHFRYDSLFLRRLCNILVIINQLIYNGIGIISPAIALEAVSGLSVWKSILICGITAIIYTTIGGVKGVVWSDVFLSFFILAGLLALVTIGTLEVGSVSRVWDLNAQWGRIQFFNFDPDPTHGPTFWTVIVGFSVFWFSLSCNQLTFQRYGSVPTLSQARKAMLINIVGLVLIGVLLCSVGIVAFAFYASRNCDPLAARFFTNPNQITPYFVMEVLNKPGLTGLFVACLSAAALSTTSSTLNCNATIIWKDFVADATCIQDFSEKMKTYIIKLIVVLFGFSALGMAFAISLAKGTFIKIVFSLTGCTQGPLLGAFILGATNPKPGKKAVILAMIIAIAVNCTLSFGGFYLVAHEKFKPHSPTHGCYNDVQQNTTHFPMTYNATTEYTGLYPTTVGDVTAMHNSTQEASHLVGWKRVFSVSYLYYPGIGVFLVVLLGSLFAFIPGFSQDAYVLDKLLFPHVRYIRHLLNPDAAQGHHTKRGRFSQLSALSRGKAGYNECEYEPEIMVTTFVGNKNPTDIHITNGNGITASDTAFPLDDTQPTGCVDWSPTGNGTSSAIPNSQ